MTSRRFMTCLAAAIAVAACLTPAAAFGVRGASVSKNPPPPSTGHWVVSNNGAAGQTVQATALSFTITGGHQRYVKSFHLTIGPDAQTSCGTGAIRVVGKHKLYDAKGTVPAYNATYNTWLVGTHNKTGIHEQKVTLASGGRTFSGGLKLAFIGRHGGKATNKGGEISGGDLLYNPKSPDGECQLNFGFKKA